ncbi:MAG: polyprenyl synthetase family protein [Bryobacterales bacterium]|nr:polyprenyl synthetase family protein [Bryobacterales bacterium]
MPPDALNDFLRDRQSLVDRELDRLLPPSSAPPSAIHAAMRHSVFAGGKRIRPLLAIAAAEACGLASGAAAAACALECVHTYSLIHDDLPALDNDDLRRGQPTCHKAYGEAVAILAGDALLTLAFQALAELDAPARIRSALVQELATAGGTLEGMLGGQVEDLAATGSVPSPDRVEYIHRAKTAALIRASVRFGGLIADADKPRLEALGEFGSRIGLAFQIVDDVLDVVSSSGELGKTAGKDEAQNKATYPAVHGVDESKRLARLQMDGAMAVIQGFGEPAWALRSIAEFICMRTN